MIHTVRAECTNIYIHSPVRAVENGMKELFIWFACGTLCFSLSQKSCPVQVPKAKKKKTKIEI